MFRPGLGFGQRYHVDRHGQLTLKQLRLSVLNEMHTNSYTGPRLLGTVPVDRFPSFSPLVRLSPTLCSKSSHVVLVFAPLRRFIPQFIITFNWLNVWLNVQFGHAKA